MSFADFEKLPAGFAEAATILDGFDLCLAVGISRLSDQERSKLTAFGEVFTGSPLGDAVAGALGALSESRFAPENLLPLAVARASLQAAQHDALRAQLATTLQLPETAAVGAPRLQVQDRQAITQLSAAQHLLAELAISGFANAQPDQLTGFAPNLEALQEHADSARAAVLLTSFLHELLETLPLASPDEVPRKRWVDLWSRGFISASYPVQPDLSQPLPVKGLFTPIGADIRSSAFFSVATIHGVFQPTDGAPAVWTWITGQSYKLDLIHGHETWALFLPELEPILQALADGASVNIKEGGIGADGRLFASELAIAAAELFDPIALTSKVAQLLPAPDAYTRHPVHLAQPVAFRTISLAQSGAGWTGQLPDGSKMPLLLETIPEWSELFAVSLEKVTQMVALLRFNAGCWQLQPLCVWAPLPTPPAPPKKKIKPPKGGFGEGWVRTGLHALAALAATPPETLEVLSERASKLLRSTRA